MSVQIHFPAIMRPLVEGRKSVSAEGQTVADIINDIEAKYPGVRERLIEEDDLLGYINLFLNDDDVRFLGRLETPVKSGDVITVLPAVAGG